MTCGTSTPTGMVTQSGSGIAGHAATWASASVVQDSGVTEPVSPLTGTTGSIGGGALLINQSASGTATVTGATTGQPCIATPTDGTDMLSSSVQIGCTVTSSNTVTVRVYALIALTPASKTYNVRVLQ
jgi:hypothetical protein